MEKLFLQEYKGIWYAFKKGSGLFHTDSWVLSDSPDLNTASVAHYNADLYRLDQCIEMFKKELRLVTRKYPIQDRTFDIATTKSFLKPVVKKKLKKKKKLGNK